MSQVVHGVRAQAQGEVAQAAQQAAEATSAAKVEAAQAVAWRLAQPRRNMEEAASSSQSATDAKMDQLLSAVSACMQQTAAAVQSTPAFHAVRRSHGLCVSMATKTPIAHEALPAACIEL